MAASDRDLLFGLLALQNSLIVDQDSSSSLPSRPGPATRLALLADHLVVWAVTWTPTTVPPSTPSSNAISRRTATSRRAWLPCRPASRPASVSPRLLTRT